MHYYRKANENGRSQIENLTKKGDTDSLNTCISIVKYDYFNLHYKKRYNLNLMYKIMKYHIFECLLRRSTFFQLRDRFTEFYRNPRKLPVYSKKIEIEHCCLIAQNARER